MPQKRRIFVISDFKDEHPKSIRMQPRMWIKGLLRLGYDVQRFSYRNVMMQCSPLPSKRIARKFAKKKTDSILAEQVRHHHPDIVFMLGLKYINAQTVQSVREVAGKAVFVARDEDPHPEADPVRIATAKEVDILISTSAGKFLQTYKDAGVPCCTFIPNMCDPDIQQRWPVGGEWKADIIFTGKPEHTRLDRNNERYDTVKRLSEIPGGKVYGAFGIPRVEGMEYFYAISGAKIGLSINIANDVQLYHSDRFINYISCGSLVLAKRVPDSDLLFENEKHVRYFDTSGEFFELADWYLKHDGEREKIAMAGMQRAHAEFNCEKIAGYLLDLIETGTYDTPWMTVL
jgi:glycosyltransferase involved in cell wall biosynthesis